MLAPRGVRAVGDGVGGPVVHAPHVLELLRRERAVLRAELVPELAHRGALHADGLLAALQGCAAVDLVGRLAEDRVRAARVRPHARERHLGRRALLKQQPAGVIEQHHRERTVDDALGLAAYELVDVVLVVGADHLVVVVNDDAFVLEHEVVLRHALAPFGGHR